MSRVLSFRVRDELADWFESYAVERGVKRQELLEHAAESFHDDCKRGVPDLRASIRKVSGAKRKGGETTPTREDFAQACIDRSELFSRLSTPASVKKWGKEGSK